MSELNPNFVAKTFEGFLTGFETDLLLEASTLSKTGMPKAMISAIHKKAEHFSEKYPRMGHTYRSQVAIPMPYKYYTPEHDIEITDPVVMTGRKSNTDPYSGRTIGSQYTDFHWFIESLPFGQNRVLIANPDLDFYMYIYDKSRSKGAVGMQYAILWWDKDKKKAVDFGYSELTTRAVDRREIRAVHDTKGGNRSDKIQEFIRSVTREGDKEYSPSRSKPLYAYKLKAEAGASKEKRAERAGKQTPVTSSQVIEVFASKYSSILPKLKAATLDNLVASIEDCDSTTSNNPNVPVSVGALAKDLSVNPQSLFLYLFERFKDFRKEIFEEGRGRLPEGTSAYGKTSGFEIEAENELAKKITFKLGPQYTVTKKTYSPDEEKKDSDSDYREAQPEKYKRFLPVSGEYASIQSIIRKHKLDGMLSKFAYFMITDKIKFPEVSVAAILGIQVAATDSNAEPDDDNWLY